MMQPGPMATSGPMTHPSPISAVSSTNTSPTIHVSNQNSPFSHRPYTFPSATILGNTCFSSDVRFGSIPGRVEGLSRARRGLEPYCERDVSRAGLLEMRPFGEAKSISGHQTLQLMRRSYGVKVSVYVVTLPAFQRCLEDGPDAAERRPRERIPHWQGDRKQAHHDLPAADSPLAGGQEAGTSRPTGNTGETCEGNPIGSQRNHSTCNREEA
nr:orf145 [Ipomoea batatas]